MVLQKYMKPADKKVQEWRGTERNGWIFSVREAGFYDILKLFRVDKGE